MTRPRIVRTPDVCFNKARLEHTRWPTEIVVSFDFDGVAIRDHYPHLTYAQINAAIDHELRLHRRLRRWLAAHTRPIRYRVAAWLLDVDVETLREGIG